MTIWRMLVACWIRKATHARAHTHALGYPRIRKDLPMRAHTRAQKHSEIRNAYCFSLQQWFRERVSLSRYTHFACPVAHASRLQP